MLNYLLNDIIALDDSRSPDSIRVMDICRQLVKTYFDIVLNQMPVANLNNYSPNLSQIPEPFC